MKRLKVFGPLMIAVLASAAAFTTTAASAEITLPQFSSASPGLGSGGKSKLEGVGGKAIEAERLTFTTTPETTRLGTFTITFLNITEPSLGATCNSLGDKSNSGTVLVHGTYHVVPRLPSGVLLLLLLLPVHLFCLLAGISVLELETGDILGILTPVNKKVKTSEHYTLSFKQSKGKQEVTEYDNDAGTMAKAQLLLSEGTGAAEEIGLETENLQLTPTVEGELKEE